MDSDVQLDRPALVRAGAQLFAGHLVETADGGFDAGSGGVAGSPSSAATAKTDRLP